MIDVIQPSVQQQQLRHPLDPLTSEEIAVAVGILRADNHFATLGERVRYFWVALHEPAKEVLLGVAPDAPIEREAFIILLDSAAGATYEVVVSLTSQAVGDWRHVPDVQPPFTWDEIAEAEQLIKRDPAFLAALARRGITDVEYVMVDPWGAGNFGHAAEEGLRLTRALPYLRTSNEDNGYARPIEGIVVLADLNRMQVLRVDDNGLVPVPMAPMNFGVHDVGPLRTDIKSLEITQPEGPSFSIEGQLVRWQNWQFRIGFTPREGLVLHTVGYEDQGRLRSILYRASLSEMVVPYGDSSPQHYFKNAFDAGEVGIGQSVNSLELGCDCLGEIRYFDVDLTDSRGNPQHIRNAICLHEEDYGMLWKHYTWRSGLTEVRRSRRLVVSSVSTLGNYEYGFFWYFYQDGSLQFEVKLTGILSIGGIAPGETPKHGVLVAPGINGILHQHFFNMRLDFDVDGQNNAIYETHAAALPPGPDNPYGNAFIAKGTLLRSELEAQQIIDPLAARTWAIVNPEVRNSLGQVVGYRLVPGENVLPLAHPDSSLIRRANFITKHLWVTPYERNERYAAGDYPNRHAGGAGLPSWTAADRSLENKDLVVWYTFGHHHVPRPEDWPVMPTAYIGFMLKPAGFFERNPALDVPPSHPSHNHDACRHA